jgi:hypothetical protein
VEYRTLAQYWFYQEPTEENFDKLVHACEYAIEQGMMTHNDADFIIAKAREVLDEQ